mgnify:CR=1 FL=1
MGRSEGAQLPSDGWEAIDANPVCACSGAALGVDPVPGPRYLGPGTRTESPSCRIVTSSPRHFITPSLFFIAHRSVPPKVGDDLDQGRLRRLLGLDVDGPAGLTHGLGRHGSDNDDAMGLGPPGDRFR